MLVAAAAAIAAVAGISAAATSCSQTPTNVPVRTFQQATKMDVVCMRVNDANGNPLDASDPRSGFGPVDRDQCTIVVPGGNTSTPEYHLYATVIQSTPGELAAVDLTNGNVVDEDHATPGINFIPVGAVPTDVAVPRAGTMTFVSSADPNKPAIYAIDNRRVLGDSTGTNPERPLTISDLPACALSQPPGALSIAQLSPTNYVVLVQLRSWAGLPAKIVAIDPGPLMRGAKIDAGPIADGASDGVVPPGSLVPCTALGAVTLATTLPASWTPAPPWPDGVPYANVESFTTGTGTGTGSGAEAGPVEGGSGTDAESDAGTEAPEAGGVVVPADAEPPPAPPGAQCVSSIYVPDGGIPLGPPLTGDQSSPSAMAMRTDRPILYVADGALPMIHAIDVSDPTQPVEQPPLLATSLRSPEKPIGVGALAVSPATRDGKVYLYATDTSDGTIMVFDVTDPASAVRTPMLRPHPELNPFQPLDRIGFSAPVVSVIFVEHDWQLPSQADNNHYYGGILCNPNPGAHPNANPMSWAKGAYYRADQAGTIVTNGTVEGFPQRLRGVFAFATLSNGTVVGVDVDDWDAPCRRPDPMDGTNTTGLLAVPQEAGPPDGGEYSAPVTFQGAADAGFSATAAVTLESFFPVSAPNRTRSNYLLDNDPSSGNHAPNLVSPPTLTDVTGATVQTGPMSPGNPLIVPTKLPAGWVDPTAFQNPTAPDPTQRTAIEPTAGTAGVRLSFDDPTAHIDQDWTVTFEGVLPNTETLVTDVITTDGYQSLTLTTGTQVDASAPANGLSTPGYCGLGIEDWTIGQARAEAIQKDNPADAWTSDYVEITDDLLQSNDPYWAQTGNDCWDGTSFADGKPDVAQARYNVCAATFGADGTDAGPNGVGTLADTYLSRDFPIVHAYDDHMVLGRFGWDPKQSATEQTTTRVVVGPDQSNVAFLKMARCCFHHQFPFKVRTGGEWVTVGQNGLGLLHHLRVGGDRSCILSCDPQDTLLNARLLDTPPVNSMSCMMGGDAGAASSATQAPFDRNDARAMRNPMFAFGMQAACGELPKGAHTLTARDLQWHFSVRGGFNPLTLSITQGSNVAVSPQSMYFIEPLSRLAIIDGEQQGLVVFDLYTLQFAEGPFY